MATPNKSLGVVGVAPCSVFLQNLGMRVTPEQLLNRKQLAKLLNVDTKTIVNWTHAGLPAVVLKARWLYLESQVRRWIAEQDWIRVSIDQ